MKERNSLLARLDEFLRLIVVLDVEEHGRVTTQMAIAATELRASLSAAQLTGQLALNVDRLTQAIHTAYWPDSLYPKGYSDPRWVQAFAHNVAGRYMVLASEESQS